MKRIVKVGSIIVIVLVVALAGLFATGVLGIPDAGLEDNQWGEVDDERIEVLTSVWIDNPNPGVDLEDLLVEYELSMNDVHLASGSADDVAAPSGTSTTELQTDLRYQELPAWWASHIDNDEVSALEADVTVHADVGPLSGSPSYTHDEEVETELEAMIAEAMAEKEGEHTLSPVSSGSETIEPTVEIRDTDAEWGDVDEQQTELYMTYDVHNPNAYPLATPALTGEFEFNDQMVAEWDAHEVDLLTAGYDATIPPQDSRELTFVVVLENEDVVEWFRTHVDNEELTDADVRAQLALNVHGETLTIPPEEDAIYCEYDLRTDIFVDQEPGIDRSSCELVPWATPDEETLDERGATLELEDTDVDDLLDEDDEGSDDTATDDSTDEIVDDDTDESVDDGITDDDTDESVDDGITDDDTDESVDDGTTDDDADGDDSILEDGLLSFGGHSNAPLVTVVARL